jgi:hypothetical protein
MCIVSSALISFSGAGDADGDGEVLGDAAGLAGGIV